MALEPIVEIVRLEESEHGTFGVLRLNKELVCATLEPQDRRNVVNISSIPAQQYRCRRTTSARFGETFEVDDVPGRSRVLFHPGNTREHTQGCILLGGGWGDFGGKRGITESRRTFKGFMGRLAGNGSFRLTIYERY